MLFFVLVMQTTTQTLAFFSDITLELAQLDGKKDIDQEEDSTEKKIELLVNNLYYNFKAATSKLLYSNSQILNCSFDKEVLIPPPDIA